MKFLFLVALVVVAQAALSDAGGYPAKPAPTKALPPKPTAKPTQRTTARPTCRPNEEYSSCGNNDCQDTCANPLASANTCPCKPGCICSAGLMRNSKGKCVEPEECDTCRENEMFTKCGNNECQNTCEEPQKADSCTPSGCTPGCICKMGYLKNSEGVCVPEESCVPKDPVCGENEEYSRCDNYPCRRTCEYINGPPGCDPSMDCNPGCVCIAGYYKNSDGVCTPENQCAYDCPAENEVFSFCGSACPKTCDEPNKVCQESCVLGCTCRDGYVRDGNNMCILPDTCPPPPCPDNEVYDKCPADPTCNNIFKGTKPTPPKPCKAGCKCNPGMVRIEGSCVPEEKCCTDPNSELVNKPNCCGGGTCAKPDFITSCSKKPDPKGCQCKKGFCKKSDSDATCIAVKDCKKTGGGYKK